MSIIRPSAPTPQTTRAHRLRVVAAFVLIAALLAPLGLLFLQFWAGTGDDESTVKDERTGVVYLRPVISLLGALDEAQAAAVRGQPVDVAKVRASLNAVDEADRQQGAALRVQDRWSRLRAQIDGVLGRAIPPGRGAFEAYGETIDLLQALAVKIGDESQLILDPVIDSYYLMDTALLRLPPVMIDAGRAADLPLVLAPPRGEQSAIEPVQVTAAKDRLARSFSAVDAGLKKSFDATASTTLGSNLLGQVDAFRSPVSVLAPGAVLVDAPTNRADPGAVAATRAELRRSALALANVTLNELDKLLSIREDAVAGQRIRAIAAAVVAALIVAGVLWLRLPVPEATPETVEVLDGPVEEPVDPATYAVQRDLVDARELLASAELVHVGRALRSPSRRESADDPR